MIIVNYIYVFGAYLRRLLYHSDSKKIFNQWNYYNHLEWQQIYFLSGAAKFLKPVVNHSRIMRKFLFLLSACLLFGIYTKAQTTLQFVPNEGQWDAPFLYKGIAPDADIYLEKNGITFSVGAGDNGIKMHDYNEGQISEPPVLKYHAYRVKWLGCNPDAVTVPGKKQSWYHNYFLGNNPDRWKTKVGIYLNVDYKNIYPKTDLHIGTENGGLKYDFLVAPGGNPDDIVLQFEGLDHIRIQKGNLILTTSVGEITEMAPYAYQYVEGVKKELRCRYKLQQQEVRFVFPDGYDESLPLVIDPQVVFATLSGSTADNWGFTATYDLDGNLYAGGIVGGPGYPTTTGALQFAYGGGTSSIINGLPCDIAISKFNASGTSLMYSTYLGGSDNEMPHSMVVDAQDNLIVAGKTFSTNYPTTSNAYDISANGQSDIIISKFNADGTALLGSTYIGGSGHDGVNISPDYSADQNTLRFNYGDNARSEVIVDKQNNIYLASTTQSTNFPLTPTAVKNTLNDSQDGVVVKFNPSLTALLWSTYVGGSNTDAAYVLALDTAQSHLYVAGGTKSADFFSSATAGSLYSNYQGGLADGFICRFENGGSYSLQKATYIGTGAYDQCYGIQVDLENQVYAMGQTMGPFPVTPNVYSNPGSPQFLIKLDSLLSSNIYSTVWGSGPSAAPNVSPVAFLVDTCQNVYISGWGGISPGSTTTGLPVTADAYQSVTDGFDFYFIVFSKNALDLLYGSFFGASGKHEHVDGGTSRFNPQGVVYQAICASCGGGTGFPSTPGVWSEVNGSNNCNLGAVKIAFNLGSVSAVAEANPNASGCVPFTVNFGNESSNATSYEWYFGDGSSMSSETTPSHTYTTTGTFTVMMIAINPNACKVRDTAYLTIYVSDAMVDAGFEYNKIDSCESFTVNFTNTSTPVNGGNFNNSSFLWLFGDGTSFNGMNPPVHNYPGPGSYEVMLILTDPVACNAPDTVIKTINFDVINVEAGFTAANICAGVPTDFSNTSVNGTSWHWDFGDGSESSDQNPSHEFAIGNYTVTLTVFNPNSCNQSDTFSAEVAVHPNPVADFAFTPIQPETNQPTTFVNLSSGANHYLWDFGDGNTSEEVSPVHQYDVTGEYKVCLTARNEFNCSDKKCLTVYADILPLADVPSGFTPNGDGTNDIVFVRGFSIKEMNFKIFNRWGEMVFESTDPKKGWDGTYNGKPQEMDAYAYILHVVFKDNTVFNKKGNITLIR